MESSEDYSPLRRSEIVMPLHSIPSTLPMAVTGNMEAQQPVASQSGLFLAVARHAWRRWWYWCLPAGVLLAVAIIAVVWLTFKPVYEAVAWLKIDTVSPFLAFADNTQGVAMSKGDEFVRTQMALIRSPIVLEPVLALPEIASIPEIEQLHDEMRLVGKAITVKSEDDSELYQIAFAAQSPVDAANMVNAVLKEYTKFHDNVGRQRSQRIITILEQEVNTRKIELTSMRSKVRDLSRQLTGEEPRTGVDGMTPVVASSPLAEWQTQLGTSQVERSVLEATLRAVQESGKPSEPSPSPELVQSVVEQQPEVRQQRQAIERERTQLSQSSQHLAGGSAHSSLDSLRKRIAASEERLIEVEKEARTRAMAVLTNQPRAEEQKAFAKQVQEMQREIQSHATLESLLAEKIEQYRQSQRGSGEAVVNLEFARRDLTRVEQVYELLLKRINELRTENRAPSRVEVLKAAGVPTRPLELMPWRLFALGGISGLMLPLALALLLEFSAQRIGESDQIPSMGQLKLCGEITTLPSRPRLGTSRMQQQFITHRAAFEDSVHYLCRSLMAAHGKELHVIALTSAVSGEGKTNLSAQLAISMAQCLREPVVLVDADVRDPDLHTTFEMSVGPGLADVLSDDSSVLEAVRPTAVANLNLLSAGKARLHPHVLLQQDRVKQVIDQLRTKFRCVIIDTPPALAIGESLSACTLADGVLICALRDVSRQHQIQLLEQRLNMAGVRVLGVVLSGVSPRVYAGKYGGFDYVS